LYRLARRGLSVERAPRSLVIDSLQLTMLQHDRLELRVLCSKGTYVRVLPRTWPRPGQLRALYSLRREYVEPFAAESMASLEQLEAAADPARDWPLLPADSALTHLAALRLAPEALGAMVHGQRSTGSPPEPHYGACTMPRSASWAGRVGYSGHFAGTASVQQRTVGGGAGQPGAVTVTPVSA